MSSPGTQRNHAASIASVSQSPPGRLDDPPKAQDQSHVQASSRPESHLAADQPQIPATYQHAEPTHDVARSSSIPAAGEIDARQAGTVTPGSAAANGGDENDSNSLHNWNRIRSNAPSKNSAGYSLLTQGLTPIPHVSPTLSIDHINARSRHNKSQVTVKENDLPIESNQHFDSNRPPVENKQAKFPPHGEQNSALKSIEASASMSATTFPMAISVPTLGQDGYSTPLNSISLQNAESRIRGHHDIIEQALSQVSQGNDAYNRSLAVDITQAQLLSASPEECTTPTNADYSESRASPTLTRSQDDGAIDSRPHSKQAEHRFTVGPEKTEKIWSIGSSGDGKEEHGQVEMSVAEAMAGVEPNARSRKASYSLRFFKEGLPREENPRRKDTKTTLREKLPSAVEEDDEASTSPSSQNHTEGRDREESQAGNISVKGIPFVASPTYNRAKTLPRSNEGDYFGISSHSSAKPSSPSRPELSSHRGLSKGRDKPLSEAGIRISSSTKDNQTTQEKDLTDHAEVGDSHDDAEADESGEEKISSAVFVPHQELGEPRTHVSDLIRPGSLPHPRTLSSSKSHPWLVKADEPEPEVQDKHDDAEEDSQLRSPPQISRKQTSNFTSLQFDERVVEVEEQELNPPEGPIVANPYDLLARDYQNEPQQPLDAIELIPYKHQVGGHTTLWRFSKRAVCKQLNNRENEFYETIETWHRDLLPFLPR